MFVRALVLGIFAAVAASPSAAAGTGSCGSTATCITGSAKTQDPRVRGALERIAGSGAKLLALRSYLRAGPGLAERWSWTQPQIEAFAGSAHERNLTAAIDGVRREFERANPGYTLWVNPEARSLDRQLQAWNSNESVTAAARDFEAAAGLALREAGQLLIADFTRFVRDYRPPVPPNLAAPGMSRHGQMYAVDFHVMQGPAVVAGTDSATIAGVWIAQGWEQRLRTAVAASGSPFVGPLHDPHEPWHYDYAPVPDPPLK